MKGTPAPGVHGVSAAGERAVRWLVLVACAWMAIVGGWELLGPVGAGHYAVVGARGIIAENMWHWGIVGPVRTYTLERPPTSLYYGNHPWGMFWLIAGAYRLFGRHEWVLRIVPVLMNVALPALLAGIARRTLGRVGAVLAAWTWAVLPITLGFAQFPGFEVPVVFGCALFSWGLVRFQERWQRRWMLLSWVGAAWTFHSDWVAYLFVAVVLMVTVVAWGLLPRRWFGAADLRRVLQWWLVTVLLAVGTLAFYGLLFRKYGLLEGMLGNAQRRTSGSELPLEVVLAARRHWIELMFPPPIILAGKLAAPLFLARWLLGRRLLDVLPLAFLAMSLVHYVVFKNGADVHIYWPLPFAAYAAFALGLLGQGMVSGLGALLGWLRPRWRSSRLELALLPLALCLPLLLLPDGLRHLDYARKTGGRLNDDGHLNQQDLDKAVAVAWAAPRVAERSVVRLHPSMRVHWGLEWNLHRPVEPAGRPLKGDEQARWFWADSRFTSSAEQRALASEYAVQVVGPYWLIDALAPPAPLTAHVFGEREPTAWEWYWRQAHDPLRRVEPDAYATWELRDAFDQTPNPPPTAPPTTREQRRIQHNLLLARGERAEAERLRQQLEAEFEPAVSARYSDGTRLLGRRFEVGVAPRLSLLFLAGERPAEETQFELRSRVVAPPRWSWTSADDKEKQVGTYFEVPPRVWRPGYLYVYDSEIRHRPGTEQFYGWFSGAGAPRRVEGDGEPVRVLELPQDAP